MAAGVSVLEARIKAALVLAGQKRLNGDLHGARELALSVLAIDEEHIEARRLLAELLAELEPPPAHAAPEPPTPPEAPAWPSMVASPEAPGPHSAPGTAPTRAGARSVSRRGSSSSRIVAVAGGIAVVAAGAALLAKPTFLRSDREAAPRPSPSLPAPGPTAVPAVAEPRQAPRDQSPRPVDPEILRQAEASLARGDYAEAQRAVNDGLRLDPAEPGLRALQRRIQADARRAANESAARMGEARSGAEKARAPELAPRVFQQARELEVAAARLYQRELWVEALAKSLEAVRGYQTARDEAQAEATRVAFEQARARVAEEERARRAAVDAAATQRPATPAASAGTQDEDRAAILAVIKGYTAAMQAKNLAALKALWPGLGGAQETKVRSGFEFAKSVRVQIDVIGVQIANGTATVACRRTDTVVTLEGRTVQSDRTAAIRLVKNNSGWSIAAIE